MDKVSFGKRINMVRDMNRITVQELAEMTGVTFIHIQQIQRGYRMPSMPCFVRLCNALKVCPSYFLQDSLEIDTNKRFDDLNRYLRLLSPEQYNMVKTMVKSLVDKK